MIGQRLWKTTAGAKLDVGEDSVGSDLNLGDVEARMGLLLGLE